MNSQTDLDQYAKSIRLTNQAKFVSYKLKLVTQEVEEAKQKINYLKKEISQLQEKAHKIQLNVIPNRPWSPRKENSHENNFSQIFNKKQIKKLQELGKKLNWT